MSKKYAAVKRAALIAIDVITQQDLNPDEGKQPLAKATLSSLGIAAKRRAWLRKPLNRALIEADVGKFIMFDPIDLIGVKTASDVILLACGRTNTRVPDGEPT